jgi:hypothetical protein
VQHIAWFGIENPLRLGAKQLTNKPTDISELKDGISSLKPKLV